MSDWSSDFDDPDSNCDDECIEREWLRGTAACDGSCVPICDWCAAGHECPDDCGGGDDCPHLPLIRAACS